MKLSKAYEYEKGDYVILQDEDFEKANLKKTKTIEIVNFIEEDEVDYDLLCKTLFFRARQKCRKRL